MNTPLLDLSNIQAGSFASTPLLADSSLPITISLAGQVLATGAWTRVDTEEYKTSIWELSFCLAAKDIPDKFLRSIPGLDLETVATIKTQFNFATKQSQPSQITLSGNTQSSMAKSAFTDYLHLSVDRAIPSWLQSQSWSAIRLLNLGHVSEINEHSMDQIQKIKTAVASVSGTKTTSRFANALKFVAVKLLTRLIEHKEVQFAKAAEENQQLLLAELPTLDKAEIKLLLNSPHKEVRVQAIKAVGEQKKRRPPAL